MSEMFMKSQPYFDKYKPVAKHFLVRRALIVYDFNQDQINVLFYAMISNQYSTIKKTDKICTFESWNSEYIKVENSLISKITKYLKL